MYNIRMYTPSSQAEACTACTGAILPPLPALGHIATLVWMESAYINKYIKTTSRMDKGRMDALVQAATLVRDGNAMARSHIPVKFSEKVQNLLSKVKDRVMVPLLVPTEFRILNPEFHSKFQTQIAIA